MSTTSGRNHEVDAVFGRVLPLIDRALVTNYRLPPAEANQVEAKLYEWFERFCRRPGSNRSIELLRSELVLMACRAGHVYSLAKIERPDFDDRLQRSLTLGPEVIAIEIENGIARRDPSPESDS
jgi:hypothetical protein